MVMMKKKQNDEKVYDHSLESTTDELINRLNLLREGNQIDLSKEDIEKAVMAHEKTIAQLDGKEPKKVIVVLGKIVNIVG